jgi:hypothetical protein
MLYGGYYDESQDGTSFSVAGFTAPCETWVHLDWAWQNLLKAWNVKYFKASECENGLGEFAQYRDDPRNLKSTLKPHEREKLRNAKTQFIDVICKHADHLHGVGAVASIEDFNRIVTEDAAARRLFMDSPYYVCLQGALITATVPMSKANATRRQSDQLCFAPVFDSHEEYSGIAKIAYEKFRTKNTSSSKVLLPMRYEDDKTTPALQVADMLAYEIRKELTKQIKSPERDTRKPMLRLIPAVDHIFRLNYASLRTIVDNQRPDSIEEYAHTDA